MKTNEVSGYTFALCDVVSVYDSSEGYRIKVRIPGTTEMDKPVEDLPYCFPLLPKLILVNPKVGEKVMVFFQKPNSKESLRLFIGPIIMQDYMINYAPGSTSDGRNIIDVNTLSTPDKDINPVKRIGPTNYDNEKHLMGPFPAPSRNHDNEGTIPPRDSIVIRGRANTDIVLNENETQIRCGFQVNPFEKDYRLKLNYNPTDLGYIQLKYKAAQDEKGNEYKSRINIVADRINLLSHDSGNPALTLGTKDELITDATMEEILNKAHPIPYGDELIAFLKDFVRVFMNHTHPFHQKPPALYEADRNALSVDLDKMLSQSIRIN